MKQIDVAESYYDLCFHAKINCLAVAADVQYGLYSHHTVSQYVQYVLYMYSMVSLLFFSWR